MSRHQFQSGPATDHYHNGLGPNHDPAGGGGAISVTDGTTTVADVTTIQTPLAGSVTELSAGTAGITFKIIRGEPDGDSGGAEMRVNDGFSTAGGPFQGTGGDSSAGGPAGSAYLTGGYGGGSIQPGQVIAGGGGNPEGATGVTNGGDVTLKPGLNGGGRDGLIFALRLPTSDPHVAGALWANSGVLTVSAG